MTLPALFRILPVLFFMQFEDFVFFGIKLIVKVVPTINPAAMPLQNGFISISITYLSFLLCPFFRFISRKFVVKKQGDCKAYEK